ncbi:MAG TPA: signal peptidase II, partial [Clostridia bacterium]|nr:signal peptidase II [Clostridia bacterium]
TAIAIAALLVYLVVARKEKKYIRLPLVVILAGGIGNLVDRIKFGYVRDFFNFQFIDFAIFNVADTCITVGAVLLILSLAVAVVKDAQKKKAAASANNSAEDGMGSDAEACFGDNGTPIEDESEESESAASDGESG